VLLHCDIAIATKSATFRAPELLRGAPDAFMSARLAEWVGLGNAKWIMFAMEAFDADRALQLGLVQEVVDDTSFTDRVDQFVAQLLTGAPQSRADVKDDLHRALPTQRSELFGRSIMSPEMSEGMTAFIEKRPPRWPR
jgi:enoyl-CoA hydratase/carnithine racemase